MAKLLLAFAFRCCSGAVRFSPQLCCSVASLCHALPSLCCSPLCRREAGLLSAFADHSLSFPWRVDSVLSFSDATLFCSPRCRRLASQCCSAAVPTLPVSASPLLFDTLLFLCCAIYSMLSLSSTIHRPAFAIHSTSALCPCTTSLFYAALGHSVLCRGSAIPFLAPADQAISSQMKAP